MVVNVFPLLQEFASMDELLRKMPMYQVCSGNKSVATYIVYSKCLSHKCVILILKKSGLARTQLSGKSLGTRWPLQVFRFL